MILNTAVDVSQETKVQLVVGQSTVGFPKQIRIIPNIADLVIFSGLSEMVSEISVKRDQVGLELGLNSDIADLKVQLSVFFESKGRFIVDEGRSCISIELSINSGLEFTIKLDAIVGGEVIVEMA